MLCALVQGLSTQEDYGLQEPVGLASLKYQICRLMRMLVQICQTLDMVPGEVDCLLLLKLTSSVTEQSRLQSLHSLDSEVWHVVDVHVWYPEVPQHEADIS